jgi:hypothetical protein
MAGAGLFLGKVNDRGIYFAKKGNKMIFYLAPNSIGVIIGK